MPNLFKASPRKGRKKLKNSLIKQNNYFGKEFKGLENFRSFWKFLEMGYIYQFDLAKGILVFIEHSRIFDLMML